MAKFTNTPGASNGTFCGQWLALVPDTLSVIATGNGGFFKLRQLTQFGAPVQGTANLNDTEVQALILIKTRQAGDAVGATMIDRPEWTALRTYNDGYGNGPLGYDVQHPLEICKGTNHAGWFASTKYSATTCNSISA